MKPTDQGPPLTQTVVATAQFRVTYSYTATPRESLVQSYFDGVEATRALRTLSRIGAAGFAEYGKGAALWVRYVAPNGTASIWETLDVPD